MHNNIPGIEVDETTFRRTAGLIGEDAKTAGIEIAADVIGGVRQLAVKGAHLMAPGWEHEAVPALVERAGISPI
jgi:hypothetical protein